MAKKPPGCDPTNCTHCGGTGYLADRGWPQDFECVNGVAIDIDEYTEGFERDLYYPPAPCHPQFHAECLGCGCEGCEGSGYVGGYAANDSQRRLRRRTRD